MFNTPTRIGAPAAPGNNATVTLFDSPTMLAGGLQQNGVRFITVDFANLDQASAVAGLRGYKSIDKGASWLEADFDVSLPLQIAAGDTTVKIYVGSAEDAKLTYTAGAVGPSAWNVTITVDGGALVQI